MVTSDISYPNPTRTCKITRMEPRRCYKIKPKYEKSDPNPEQVPKRPCLSLCILVLNLVSAKLKKNKKKNKR